METNTKQCLSVHENKVTLDPCAMEPHLVQQMWTFEHSNTNPEFKRAYPNTTIEDWEFVEQELSGRPESNMLLADNFFRWGQIQNKKDFSKSGSRQNTNVHDN